MNETWAVILNWNSIEKTVRAVESVLGLASPPRVVVVDNGSHSSEGNRLRTALPNVLVTCLPENVGFARAVNIGADIALQNGAESILLFNNDAWFEPKSDTLDVLKAALGSAPNVAAAGPKVFNADGSLQSAGYCYSLWFPIASKCRTVKPHFLSGSCLLVRADSFARLGGLDPDFFLYGDDVDFALRVREGGESIVLAEHCAVFHERAAANKIYSANYTYTALRSSLINVRKHASAVQVPTSVATLVAASAALALIGVRAGDQSVLPAIFRAWRDFVSNRWGGYHGSLLVPVERPSLASRRKPIVFSEASAAVNAIS